MRMSPEVFSKSNQVRIYVLKKILKTSIFIVKNEI